MGARSIRTRIFGPFQQYSRIESASTQLTHCAGGSTRLEHGTSGVVTRRCSNGTVEVLQFNERGQLEASLRYHKDRYGRSEGWVARYGYSPEGDLMQIADSARGTTLCETDAAHRLTAEHTPDGSDYSYPQDSAGNLLARPGIKYIELATGNRLFHTSHETFAYDERHHVSQNANVV
jgi:YD repeat-containing protein